MDAITKAVFAAAKELQGLGWTLDDAGLGENPTEESQFIRILVKHMQPFADQATHRNARIAALRAELAALEAA